ncbi:DNA-formamidopyrimidine glycosylase family protein [Ornithinimicrobium sp. INDO-MA30-4]|uniref:DNA-formamidopyrimidine glycosylase family protein n=1 Tax=Ornithinimicrobium sp. INDO-MA30-4 TaxID=2908651 RepID=UPI001F3FEA42|nr:DNA-formamidopyrimidine glycosylase family protein [Ornithinimicrobium sp. INDO-MA30-4]UJH70745.1 Fpg/Nei family DNA glycosylase [Ornithinimicrobium sp. INDO-MA30-4]
MPEGDSVWRAATKLHQALAGKVLTRSDFRVPRFATVDLVGRQTLQVVPHGKHLLHRVEGGVTIHSHLKMEGRWMVLAQESLPPAARRHTVRALLSTSTHLAIGDSLGMLDVLATHRETEVVGHVGPDLLGVEFDRDQAVVNLGTDPARAIAAAMLDQRNAAGMGTIYVSEPLFAHHINPSWPVARVAEQLPDILDTARRMLVMGARTGREPMQVHGRRGLPCLQCGQTIRWAPIGSQPAQRQVSYCPGCQGGLAAGDDGAPVNPLGHRGSA